MLDECQEIYQRIRNIGSHYQKQKRSLVPSDLTKIIRRQLDNSVYCVSTSRDLSVSPDMIIVSGFYDCYDDSQHLPSIYIELSYCPEQKYYFTHLVDWEKLSFDIAEAIGHEIVHRTQHRSGTVGKSYHSHSQDPDLRADQEYFGQDIEIEAYGFSIAFESMHKNIPYESCEIFKIYKNTFDDKKIILKLRQHIVKYLKLMELRQC